MIVFDLACAHHCPRFEGWFRSSEDFDRQLLAGLLCCPNCGGADVRKALQAPRLARKGNQRDAIALPAPVSPQGAVGQGAVGQGGATTAPASPLAATPSAPVAAGPLPAQAAEMLHKLVQIQTEILRNSRDVGKAFAEDARAMHYGDKEAEPIHGHASPQEARDLIEEGIEILPLPFPTASPDKAN